MGVSLEGRTSRLTIHDFNIEVGGAKDLDVPAPLFLVLIINEQVFDPMKSLRLMCDGSCRTFTQFVIC